MTLTPFPLEGFGGLNLTDDPLEVGAQGATDLKNVWLPGGRIQTCPTVSAFATATRAVTRLFTHADASQILASEADGANVTLQAFSAGGSSVAATSYASANIYGHSFASVGTSAASATYAVRSGDTTRKWNGAAWSTVAGIPDGRCCSVNEDGTRLVVGGGSLGDRVYFSSAGAPETFNTADPGGDWVDIAPGDGETVIALVRWANKLFAFKNTKFAVFTGASEDADGGAEFNFYMVDTGVGVGSPGIEMAPGGAVAGRDGVYFLAADGVYRTTGGAPEMVSRAIAPVWKPSTYAATTTIPRTSGAGLDEISAVGEDIFVSVLTYDASPTTATFVLHEGKWTFLTIQANGAHTASGNFVRLQDQTFFAVPGSTGIKELSFLTGPSTSLAWSYTSGRYTLAPGRVAYTNSSSVVGSGTVAMSLTTDLYGTLAGPGATLGTAPAIAEGWPMTDQEGNWFQHTLSGTGAVSVARLTHWISGVKPAGVQ